MNDTKNQIDTASRSSGAENVAETPAQNSADSVTPSREELGTAVDSINQFVSAQMRTLNFSVDENSGKAVVKVIDFETKDVIRQIPGEEVLKMASAIKRLQDDLGPTIGLLVNRQV
jgi:flagellar protein FlaG